jgi:Tfp pilus assembly protein FimT
MVNRGRGAGFTLVDLLIAAAFLGLLASIAIPNAINAQRRSRATRTSADAEAAVTRVVASTEEKGVYPAGLVSLRAAGDAFVADADP